MEINSKQKLDARAISSIKFDANLVKNQNLISTKFYANLGKNQNPIHANSRVNLTNPRKNFTRKIARFFAKFTLILCLICAINFAIFLLLDYLFPLNLDALHRPQSEFLYDKNGREIAARLASDEIWRVDTDEIPPLLKNSAIYFEDRYFYEHFGVNFFSIIRASAYNLTHKNQIGASTITMQVARMMEPKKRSYSNKIIEIFRAFELEYHFSKDEILKFYFNLAPYGGNIEGAKMASRIYFNRDLNELSIAQTALLSVVPKNPNANRLDRKSNIKRLKNRALKELFTHKIIDKSAYERGLAEKNENRRYEIANLAPHYAQMAFKNGISHSNLDLNLQIPLTNLLKNHVNRLQNRGVKNASAIIIDNQKMSVVAYVGSHDLGAFLGENDGVASPKNIGSTLKPFIYANAIDAGLITPKSRLIDTELHFGRYVPQNYLRDYNGEISASDALNFSLNIPATKLNLALGKNSIYETLKSSGIALNSKEFYGDSIALGAVEISLIDLALMYSAFSNKGAILPLEIAGEKRTKFVANLEIDSINLSENLMQKIDDNFMFWNKEFVKKNDFKQVEIGGKLSANSDLNFNQNLSMNANFQTPARVYFLDKFRNLDEEKQVNFNVDNLFKTMPQFNFVPNLVQKIDDLNKNLDFNFTPRWVEKFYQISPKFYGNANQNFVQILSPQSAFITTKMLENTNRAYLGSAWESANKPKIALKTGTSAGNRDLYAVAFSKNFTIAVWMGSFNGAITDGLTGSVTSAIVALEMFDEIAKNYDLGEFVSQDGVVMREVCVDAFLGAGEAEKLDKNAKNLDENLNKNELQCKKKAVDFYVKPIKRECDFYTQEELFFMLKNGLIDTQTLLKSVCASKFKNIRPLIAFPFDKEKIIAYDDETIVKFQCFSVFGDEIYMKIEDRYEKLKNGAVKKLKMRTGSHKIGCLDEMSNFSESSYEVVRF